MTDTPTPIPASDLARWAEDAKKGRGLLWPNDVLSLIAEVERLRADNEKMREANEIVGHKTIDTGETCPETGFPKLRHEPLTRAEADAIHAAIDAEQKARAERMPDDQAAIRAMMDAWLRLKELGWNDGKYSPRNGVRFKAIELGSTGIFDCDCVGEWPNCTWTTYDDRDAYPSSQAPALFRLYPEDQAKHDARMVAARSALGASDV